MLSPIVSSISSLLPLPFSSNALVLYGLSALISFVALRYIFFKVQVPLRFAWNCFFKPISSKTGKQSERLDSFYSNQADLYDATRGGLLKGRTQLLELVASHLRVQSQAQGGEKVQPKKKLIWVDIGGGSGWNVEKMDEYMSIPDSFEAVYLVDLCEPLLKVARERFAKRGWKNVHCLHQDASEFLLPSWTSSLSPTDPHGSVDLVTLSYSLSMIPSYHAVLDRVEGVLNPTTGLLGVVDFYTSNGAGSTARERAIGSARRKVGWFSALFWEVWFSFDHVHLSASRRDYLEYKFGTIKSFNGRNGFIIPFLIQIPFYVNISCSRSRNISSLVRALNTQTGSSVGQASPVLMSPLQRPVLASSPDEEIPSLNLGRNRAESITSSAGGGSTVVTLGIPASSFHYQAKGLRVPYLEEKVHDQFRSHIYGFTWEDPVVDIQHLNLTKDDSMLVITSAGDNALHYAAAIGPKRIHCVDMNPCQGHILELKLAGIQALSYEEFFDLFGLGRVPNFQALLDGKLAPYLSSHAYQYWCLNAHYFKTNFHYHGYSGAALRFAHAAFRFFGLTKGVKAMASASNVWEQDQIYKETIRPLLTNSFLIKILSSPVFLWNALGVPINQANCLLKDGSVQDFVLATFDPIPKMGVLSKGAYHYLLCLLGHYTPQSCPLYLTRSGFEKLKLAELSSNESAFRLHTESIYTVLASQPSSSLTKIILMDSMDWFDPIPSSTPLPLPPSNNLHNALSGSGSKPESLEVLRSSLDHQILEIKRVLSKGGEVYWRSAGKRPFYVDRFSMAGFKVTNISVRENGKGIDRVNMYASFWKASI